jgi:hypothetical protein
VGAQPLDELFAGHAGPWTEQECAALPESMGRVELLDGALVVTPFPAVSHQRLVRNLARALAAAPVGFEVFDGLNIMTGFVASARAASGRRTLERPSPVDLDLTALATATRYPAP